MTAKVFDGFAAGSAPAWSLATLAHRFAAWRETARQRRALAALPPEMLRDIGLDAEAAAAEAERAFWDLPMGRR
mgnify:CR=1 FL=1